MAKNQFYFYFLANDFDQIWVQNSPKGPLQHGLNRIVLKTVVQIVYIKIFEPWDLLYQLDCIIVQKNYNDTKNAMILKYKYLFCGLLSS